MHDIDKDHFPEHEVHPMYRLGTQVHDHEARIRLLERDSADIKKTLEVLSDTISDLSCTLETKLNVLGSGFHTALTQHTKEEFLNLIKIMAYFITALLAILGSGVYLLLEHFVGIP